MRVAGLATGMDTESIIRDMMAAQRMPLDKITQKKQFLEWQLDDYRSINRDLTSFRDNTFDEMILTKNFTAKTVNVSSPDDVSIRNLSSMSDFSGTLQVHHLARNATLQSGKLEGQPGKEVSLDTELKDLAGSDGEKELTIRAINSEGKLGDPETLTFGEDATIGSIIKEINDKTDVHAFFDEYTGKIGLTAKNSGRVNDGESEIIIGGQLAEVLNLDTKFKSTLQSGKIEVSESEKASLNTALGELTALDDEDTIEIEIGAINSEGKLGDKEKLEFKATDTIDTIIKRINSETDVDAFFDELTGKITLTAKHSGKVNEGGSEIVIEGGLAEVLKLTEGTVGEVPVVDESNRGQNAIFTYNGLRTQRSTNTFELNGFEVTLKQATAPLDENTGDWETAKVEPNAKTITFSSAPDTDKILDTVVKFVDSYNTMIEELNGKIRETKYRDFHPLSQEQKNEMKEKEIELWEEKAMSGTLRNDSIISSMLTKMRTAMMDPVGGVEGVGTMELQGELTVINSLESIGIKQSTNYLDRGKLIIDEDLLREAIETDPSMVHALFAQDGDEPEGTGFARRIREIVDETRPIISARAGQADSGNHSFTLGRNLNEMDKQIERFEARLEMTENRLWKQFTAMEMAIQRANAQSAQLMSSFGGGM